ncbi:MAG TPA: hypothetical protein VFQ84_08830 [Arenimonas sp.]|uniref:hypothetical protein n=1 Tax=Arenimonas sp. TaxID=1872635 RepID=UPI002D80A2FB|nr:hypothetical protein [Arenimonas sp.]HEU0153434.1 hypothetical protein [Arenimonas sp.]
MSRRILLLAAFLLVGPAGCVSYGDYAYERDRYPVDGGYYYPADEGYGDYYEAPEDYGYYDYYDDPFAYGYLPFWSIERYACSGWYGCSPYWSTGYRRPYSGWSLSFGNHWDYRRWAWYGDYGSGWYDPGYYRPHRPRPPGHGGRPGDGQPPGPPPGAGVGDDPGTVRPTPMPRPDFDRNRIGRPVIREPEGRPGNGGGNPRPPVTTEEREVRPLPRTDFRDSPRKAPGDGGTRPRPIQSTPSPRPDARPAPGNPPDYRRFERPEPVRGEPGLAPRPVAEPRPQPEQRYEPRPQPRYEPRPEPRPQPRLEPRQEPRYQPRPEPRPEPRSAPREAYRPAPPPASRPAPPPREASRPAPPPPRERPAPEETRTPSQNRGREVED